MTFIFPPRLHPATGSRKSSIATALVTCLLWAASLHAPSLAQVTATIASEGDIAVQLGGNVFFRYSAGLLANVPTESNQSATFDILIGADEAMFTHFLLSTSEDYEKATKKTITLPLSGEKVCMQVQRQMKRHDNLNFVQTNDHCVSGKLLGRDGFEIVHTYRSRHKNPPTRVGRVKIPDGLDETLTLVYAVRLSEKKHNEAFLECSARVTEGDHTFSSLLMNGKWAKSQAKIKPQPLTSCLWSRL